MSIKKLAVAVAFGVFMAGGSVVFAQGPVAAEEAVEEAAAEEAVEEEAAPPAPVAPPVAAAVEAPAPAPSAEAKPAAKPEPKVDLYGAVQYRFRYRIHSLTDTSDNSGSTYDYLNLFAWRLGVKTKVDNALSLQIQIGNDWNAGEEVTWAANNTKANRAPLGQNFSVHIASFKWNPGSWFVEGGVISLPSNGTLDLLERSLSLGHYGEAGFQGWATETNSSMIGIKVGVPIVKEGVKVGAELFQSVIDQRAQTLAAKDNIAGNPTSPIFVFTLPVEAGAFKITPEATLILNRNWNNNIEKGDNEFLVGGAAGYKVNDGVSLSLAGGYGSVSNENSRAGTYSVPGNRVTSINQDSVNALSFYNANGLLVGVGTVIKAGPGNLQIDVKYNNTKDAENEDGTSTDYIYTDLRYGVKVHDKVTVTPRYRNYYRTLPKNNVNASRMENRLELFVEGSF
jgi:hypothetical protein